MKAEARVWLVPYPLSTPEAKAMKGRAPDYTFEAEAGGIDQLRAAVKAEVQRRSLPTSITVNHAQDGGLIVIARVPR